jgi:hypothetical protein
MIDADPFRGLEPGPLFGAPEIVGDPDIVLGCDPNHLAPGARRRGRPTAAAAPAGAFLVGRVADHAHPAEVEAALDLHDHRLMEVEALGLGIPVVIVFAVALEPHFDHGRHQASAKTPMAAYFSPRRRISFEVKDKRRSC